MANQVVIVGIGPGSPDYVVPAAKKEIDAARVLIGSRRALETFAPAGVETKVIDSDIDGVLSYIGEKLAEDSVIVLVSGDPGFYSLLSAVRRRFAPELIRVIPGISSVQMAFARISEPWQEAQLISMHGRRANDDALAYIPGKRLGILTDNAHNPAAIASILLEAGWPKAANVRICASLSYPDETILCLTLEEAASLPGYGHSVMVVMS